MAGCGRLQDIQEDGLEKHLYLRLEIDLELEQKYGNDAEGKTEHLGIGGHPIRTQGSTEVVFDDRVEDVTCVED